MQVEQTALPGVVILTPRRFGDGRGHFSETWNRSRFAGHGIACDFVQDNQSLSVARGTVRGLHCQAPPHAQAKLVRVVAGAVLDVAVDVRRGSPDYGRWVAVPLSAADGRQLFIPEGFLHGFVTLEPMTEVLYKCSAHYAPECERAVRFDDPAIGVDWGIDPAAAILSEKDAAAGSLGELDSPFAFAPP